MKMARPGYTPAMRIRATDDVAAAVRERGGRLYVWTSAHRCCSGPLVRLEAGAEPPKGAARPLPRLRRRRLRGAARHGRAAPARRARARLRGRRHKVVAFWTDQVGWGESFPLPAPPARTVHLPRRRQRGRRGRSRAQRSGPTGAGGGHGRPGLHLLRARLRQYLQRRRMHQLAWAIGSSTPSPRRWRPSRRARDLAPVHLPHLHRHRRVAGRLSRSGDAVSGGAQAPVGRLLLRLPGRLHGGVLHRDVHDTLDPSKLVPGITVGGQALGESLSFPRFMSLPINITGTLLLFGGALWSIIRFIGKREYAYRVWANVLIAAGAPAGVARFAGAARRHDRAVPGRDGRRRAHAGRVPRGRDAGQGHPEAQGAAWGGARPARRRPVLPPAPRVGRPRRPALREARCSPPAARVRCCADPYQGEEACRRTRNHLPSGSHLSEQGRRRGRLRGRLEAPPRRTRRHL